MCVFCPALRFQLVNRMSHSLPKALRLVILPLQRYSYVLWGGLTAASSIVLACHAWGDAQAQPVPLQSGPRAPLSVSPGVPPEMLRALESQRAGFEAYQQCVAAHRTEVELHYAAADVLQFRNQRTMLEAAFAANPRARQQYPGGVEQMGAAAFARYRSLGGTARTIAEVQPIASPCPPPGPSLPSARSTPQGGSPVTQSRQLNIQR